MEEDPVMEEVPAMEEDQDPTTEGDSDSDLCGEESNFEVKGMHKVYFDAPNTYICIFTTVCNIHILIQFASVRTKRVRYNHGLL